MRSLRQKLEKERKIDFGDFVPKCLTEEEENMISERDMIGNRREKKRMSGWKKRAGRKG
jgi:hypothetical protein